MFFAAREFLTRKLCVWPCRCRSPSWIWVRFVITNTHASFVSAVVWGLAFIPIGCRDTTVPVSLYLEIFDQPVKKRISECFKHFFTAILSFCCFLVVVLSEFIRTVLTVCSSFLWVYFGTISKIQCKTAQTLLANWITLLAKLLYKLFSGTSIEMLFSRVSIEIFMYTLNKGLNPPKYVRIS